MCFWCLSVYGGEFIYYFLFTVTVTWVNTCAMSLCCSPAPNKIAGSLDMEYPWPVTQQWPEEVMSGENVAGPVRQADSRTDMSTGASLFLLGISYQFSLMSVQVTETNSKHPSPLISFTSTGSLLFLRIVLSLLLATREAGCWNKVMGQVVFPTRRGKALPAWQCLCPKQDVPASCSFSFDHGLEGRWSPTSQPWGVGLRKQTPKHVQHTHCFKGPDTECARFENTSNLSPGPENLICCHFSFFFIPNLWEFFSRCCKT